MGDIESSIGLDNVWRISPYGRFGLPIAMKGGWESDTAFSIHFNEIANINNGTIRMVFDDDGSVVVEMSESTWHLPVIVKGKRKDKAGR
jgi:hypothetical protein